MTKMILLVLLPLTMASDASAQSRTFYDSAGRGVGRPPYAQPYAPYWSGRSDPSFGNRIAIDNERANGRCAVDLGYGRWEPCG